MPAHFPAGKMLPAGSWVCHIPVLWQTQKSCVGNTRSVDQGVESQGGSVLSAMWCKQRSWSKSQGRSTISGTLFPE